jgi:hypothetical protein
LVIIVLSEAQRPTLNPFIRRGIPLGTDLAVY